MRYGNIFLRMVGERFIGVKTAVWCFAVVCISILMKFYPDNYFGCWRVDFKQTNIKYWLPIFITISKLLVKAF